MAVVQVIGLGRVGLPLAVLAAQAGHDVVGVDVDERVRAEVAARRAPFREPGLDDLLQVVSDRIWTRAEPVTADVHVIAVPTPVTSGRRANLDAVWSSVARLAGVVRETDLVVLESTCPPGTACAVAERLRRERRRVAVATATERVLPGRILDELERLERVVGGVDAESTSRAAAFYRALGTGGVESTDARTAEVVKLVENAFRDVNVAFANEVDMLCAELGVDTHRVIDLANRHPRVGILAPGPGVGGDCLPVDPWFLIQDRAHGSLVRAARAVNDDKVRWSVERVLEQANGRRIACLGLTYKPDVDDLRNSPALRVVELLRDALPGRVRACDPFAVGRVEFAEARLAEVLRWSEVLVALVPHAGFRALPEHLLKGRHRIDLCGLWTERRDSPDIGTEPGY